MGESGLKGSRVGVARAVPAREAPSCLLPVACPCHHTPLGRKRCPPKGQGQGIDRGRWVYWVGHQSSSGLSLGWRGRLGWGHRAWSRCCLGWWCHACPLQTASSCPCTAWRWTACAPMQGRPAHSPTLCCMPAGVSCVVREEAGGHGGLSGALGVGAPCCRAAPAPPRHRR